MITYVACNSCFSRDTYGNLKVWLSRQFCVQEFSADAKLHELALQRSKVETVETKCKHSYKQNKRKHSTEAGYPSLYNKLGSK